MTSHHPKPSLSRFTVQYVTGAGYVVADPDGKWQGKPSPFRLQVERLCADMQREADRAAKRGNRPCLRCGHEFKSEGIHNRMCGPCRNVGSVEQSVRPAIPARKFG